ncbi:hypothetical protein [Usitatibacter palustris]|nr:hypothetical protein [Usitatibacter palustris]
MSRSFVITALLVALAGPALADYDAKMEAEEARQRKAAAAAEAKRKADYEKQRSAIEAKGMRKELGKEAEGKSDAEVKQIYNAKVKAQVDMAKQVQSGSAPPGSDAAKSDAQVKAMTGKSTKELQNMTPAEQAAFAKQMEKQYGGAK